MFSTVFIVIFASKKMLRIDEIREKLSRIPEPVEVTQIRENILNNFNRIEFVEDVHKYYLPNINGEKEELMSVSAFIHQYEKYGLEKADFIEAFAFCEQINYDYTAS